MVVMSVRTVDMAVDMAVVVVAGAVDGGECMNSCMISECRSGRDESLSKENHDYGAARG
jgi:hypothetical protein